MPSLIGRPYAFPIFFLVFHNVLEVEKVRFCLGMWLYDMSSVGVEIPCRCYIVSRLHTGNL